METMKKIKFPFINIAIDEAHLAEKNGEVPVGAVIVETTTGKILAKSGNRIEHDGDPTAHAEIITIRKTTKIMGSPRLENCDIYVTLEPCPMCATAISFARLRRLYFGAFDPKSGGVEHGPRVFTNPSCHHTPEVYGGIEETRCSVMLKDFFLKRR